MGLDRRVSEAPLFGFIGLRSGYLRAYKHVRLTLEEARPYLGYQLRCLRRSTPSGGPEKTLAESLRENRRRVPPLANFDEKTTISAEEAHYLTEHPFAFKCGRFFHFTRTWEAWHEAGTARAVRS